MSHEHNFLYHPQIDALSHYLAALGCIDHGHFDYIFPEITLFTSKERQSRFQNKFAYQNLPTYNLYFDACSHITKCFKIFPAFKEAHGIKTFNSLLQSCKRCC